MTEAIDRLLQEIICKVTEPMLLIDSKRGVLFASDSFKRLAGIREISGKCTSLLVPSFSAEKNTVCCWDVQDIYLRRGEKGIWTLKRSDGAYLPVLCSISTLDIAHSAAVICLCIKPLPSAPSASNIYFFRSMFDNLCEQRAFKEWSCGYFREIWGLKSPIWMNLHDTSADHPNIPLPLRSPAFRDLIISAMAQTRSAGPFDVTVLTDDQAHVFHVFPANQSASQDILVLKGRRTALDEQMISELMAAVCVANEAPTNAKNRAPAMKGPTLLAGLTSREKEVLALLAQGLAHREIGLRMHVSIHTVKNHIRSLMHKCNVNKSVNLATLYVATTQTP